MLFAWMENNTISNSRKQDPLIIRPWSQRGEHFTLKDHGLMYSKYCTVFRLNGVTGEIIQNLKQLHEK